VSFVKRVFTVDDLAEGVPPSPHQKDVSEIKAYLKNAIQRWVDGQKASLESDGDTDWIVHENELYPFLESVSSVDLTELAKTVQRLFWNFRNRRDDCSKPFISMILNNAFLWGSMERPTCSNGDTAYDRLCRPFINRIEFLAETSFAREDGRPEYIDGDDEIRAISSELQLI